MKSLLVLVAVLAVSTAHLCLLFPHQRGSMQGIDKEGTYSSLLAIVSAFATIDYLEYIGPYSPSLQWSLSNVDSPIAIFPHSSLITSPSLSQGVLSRRAPLHFLAEYYKLPPLDTNWEHVYLKLG